MEITYTEREEHTPLPSTLSGSATLLAAADEPGAGVQRTDRYAQRSKHLGALLFEPPNGEDNGCTRPTLQRGPSTYSNVGHNSQLRSASHGDSIVGDNTIGIPHLDTYSYAATRSAPPCPPGTYDGLLCCCYLPTVVQRHNCSIEDGLASVHSPTNTPSSIPPGAARHETGHDPTHVHQAEQAASCPSAGLPTTLTRNHAGLLIDAGLLLAGDVESNPGPHTDRETSAAPLTVSSGEQGERVLHPSPPCAGGKVLPC